MPYVALDDLRGKIPQTFLVQALDDDRDGEVDAGLWELIQSQADQAVDSRLGQRYPVPFDDPPAIVSEAALIFACEAIYARRVGPEQNPWMGMGNAMRSRLERIGSGDESLTPEIARTKPSGGVISEPARTYSSAGRLAI